MSIFIEIDFLFIKSYSVFMAINSQSSFQSQLPDSPDSKSISLYILSSFISIIVPVFFQK
ncbi:MAG: hypothetical protein P1U46_04380 [Patescibacteria group bacterium]|nr:hypothetical protein [Patescibacteria group bacterium]